MNRRFRHLELRRDNHPTSATCRSRDSMLLVLWRTLLLQQEDPSSLLSSEPVAVRAGSAPEAARTWCMLCTLSLKNCAPVRRARWSLFGRRGLCWYCVIAVYRMHARLRTCKGAKGQFRYAARVVGLQKPVYNTAEKMISHSNSMHGYTSCSHLKDVLKVSSRGLLHVRNVGKKPTNCASSKGRNLTKSAADDYAKQ